MKNESTKTFTRINSKGQGEGRELARAFIKSDEKEGLPKEFFITDQMLQDKLGRPSNEDG
jgi:hypothetical protein